MARTAPDQDTTPADNNDKDNAPDGIPPSDYESSLEVVFDPQHGAEICERRLWRLLCTPIITVLVGPSKQRFFLHRALLRCHSLFFRSMLRHDRFPESQTQTVKLLEDDVASFAAFAEWLYMGQECDADAIFKDAHGMNVSDNDDDFSGSIGSDFSGNGSHKARTQPLPGTMSQKEESHQTGDKAAGKRADEGNREKKGQGDDEEDEEDEEDKEDEEEKWKTGSALDSNDDYINYDFTLHFSCYVLAEKLQAPAFKRHILDEIWHFGDFWPPSYLTVEQVRYAYSHTSSRDDPLRKFCLQLKCVRTPINETLEDPDFQQLMEDGGPLVGDVMEICRKHVVRKNWNDLYVIQKFP